MQMLNNNYFLEKCWLLPWFEIRDLRKKLTCRWKFRRAVLEIVPFEFFLRDGILITWYTWHLVWFNLWKWRRNPGVTLGVTRKIELTIIFKFSILDKLFDSRWVNTLMIFGVWPRGSPNDLWGDSPKVQLHDRTVTNYVYKICTYKSSPKHIKPHVGSFNNIHNILVLVFLH